MKDDPDLVFDDVFLGHVTKLKEDFEKLLPEEQMSDSSFDSSALNNYIIYEEVSNAIDFLSCISVWKLTQHWLEMTMATIR